MGSNLLIPTTGGDVVVLVAGTPTNGQAITWDAATARNVYSTISGGGFTVSSAAPGSPALGDRWLDSDTGVEYTWVEDGDSNQWVELPAPDGGGSSGLTSPQALARSLGS